MEAADDYRTERDKMDYKLSEIGNLVAALEIIAWQFAQVSMEGETARLRDALIGISKALGQEIEQKDA